MHKFTQSLLVYQETKVFNIQARTLTISCFSVYESIEKINKLKKVENIFFEKIVTVEITLKENNKGSRLIYYLFHVL